MGKPQPKQKNVHLSLSQKMALRRKIFERDNNCCVVCGAKAEHWHHHPFGSNKSDELEKGVALCAKCHDALHNDPKNGRLFQLIVQEYLNRLYGGKNDNHHQSD